MSLEILNIFARAIAVGVAASITVGPMAILCIQRTLSKSRRSGVISGFGVAAADTLLALVSYIFYSLLQHRIEEYDVILTVVGGAVVVAVGGYIFMQNPAVQMRRNRSAKSSSWQDFISTFGLTLTNFVLVVPYILAFFAIFAIPSFNASTLSGLLEALFVVGGFLLGASLWWTAIAYFVNLFRRKFRPRHMHIINRTAGAVIAALGCFTILSTFFHLIPNELFK